MNNLQTPVTEKKSGLVSETTADAAMLISPAEISVAGLGGEHFFSLGLEYYKSEKYGKAVTAFKQALRIEPANRQWKE
ncbi:MAG TPA: tetratricopeptide repeat protein, partial [Flavisolibacter sp.]|nr:tetratricopeptide repeat protein [Flavisolibacter sp.]